SVQSLINAAVRKTLDNFPAHARREDGFDNIWIAPCLVQPAHGRDVFVLCLRFHRGLNFSSASPFCWKQTLERLGTILCHRYKIETMRDRSFAFVAIAACADAQTFRCASERRRGARGRAASGRTSMKVRSSPPCNGEAAHHRQGECLEHENRWRFQLKIKFS